MGYGLEFEVKVRVFTVRVRELDLESYCSLAVLSNSDEVLLLRNLALT